MLSSRQKRGSIGEFSPTPPGRRGLTSGVSSGIGCSRVGRRRGRLARCGAAALGAIAFGCYAGVDPDEGPEETLGSDDATLEPYGSAALTLGGQAYTLTWEDDFGGALNGGQPKSYLNANVWKKENLGVNYEQQAYTNNRWALWQRRHAPTAGGSA